MNQTPLNILLIDDNSDDAVLLKRDLANSSFGPFAVTHVKLLAEAIGLMQGHRFDAVLVDLGLPDSQGLATLERLRKQTPREVPILVFSGLDDHALRLRVLQAGAEDYLAKDASAGNMRAQAVRYAIQRNRCREAFAASEQQLAMAVDAANLGIFDWDLKTEHIRWSFHHARLFGLAPGEFDGTVACAEKCVHPDDRSRWSVAFDLAFKARGEYQCEYRVIWPDSSEHWIEAHGKVFSDDRGTPTRMMGTVMDISQRKVAEDAAAIREMDSARMEHARLTPRELTLLKLVAGGMPNKLIAIHLKISVRTVAKHRSNLMAKTHALNAADLARMTTLAGILPTE